MKNNIDRSISSAVDEIAPSDMFSKILQSLPDQERKIILMKNKSNKRISKIILAIAAALAIVLTGAFASIRYVNNYVIDSIVDIDVNPSVELKINRNNRVVRADAVNKDGELLIKDMNLKNTDLNVAINALIGSMVKNGFLTDKDNGILVSVQNPDAKKAEHIRNLVLADLNDSLKTNSVSASILNQTLTNTSDEHDTAESFANEHKISYGKAVFILNLCKKDPSLNANELAGLSLRDITKRISDNRINVTDIIDYDYDDSLWENIADQIEDTNEDKNNLNSINSKDHITAQKAKEIALKHAGIKAEDATFVRAELDEDDGVITYEVEFIKNRVEYEYEIDASTGKIINHESEIDD